MDNMPMPQEDSQEEDNSIMVNMSSLGENAKDLKVGDTVEMKIDSIEGDMVKMSPDTEDDSEETDPSTMPMDKLEASLPKAPERE
jgi:hypothetical protein